MATKKQSLTKKKDNRHGVKPSSDLVKKVKVFIQSNTAIQSAFLLGTTYDTLKKVSKGMPVAEYIIERLTNKLQNN